LKMDKNQFRPKRSPVHYRVFQSASPMKKTTPMHLEPELSVGHDPLKRVVGGTVF